MKTLFTFVFLIFGHSVRAEVLTLSQAVALSGQYIGLEAMALFAASECRAVPAGQWQSGGGTGNTLVWAGAEDSRDLMEQAAKYSTIRQGIMGKISTAFPQVGHEIEEGFHKSGGIQGIVERLRVEAGGNRRDELGWCAVQKVSIDYMSFNILKPVSANPTIVAD